MKKIWLVSLCLVAMFLAFGMRSRTYFACPDWDIYVVNQDGTPMPGVAVHAVAMNPRVEEEYSATDLTTDAQGHIFVPRRAVRASRLRAFWGVLKQVPLLAHGEVNANGYASIPPPPGYGYPNPGEPGEGGAYWYKETPHVISRVILNRCTADVRRNGCN